MKRQTAMALAAVFAMSVAGTALAAPVNPFVDVPAKHWSYDSINQLAKAGVISGYGDGTYQGDKTLTRYEAATLVAKAMANADKLNPENKKALEALKTEFGAELNNLGVRVSNIENRLDNVKITGEVRLRYTHEKTTPNGGVATSANGNDTRSRITFKGQINDQWSYTARIQNVTDNRNATWNNVAGDSSTLLNQAYVSGKIFGGTYNLGKQDFKILDGLVWDSTAGTLPMKGAIVSYPITNGAVTAIYGTQDTPTIAGLPALTASSSTVQALQATTKFGVVDFGAAYARVSNFDNIITGGINQDALSAWEVNAGTKIGPDFYLGAAYAKSNQNIQNKAITAGVTYKTFDYTKAGSFSAWAQYRKLEANSTLNSTYDVKNILVAGNATGSKGYEVGFLYAPWKNAEFKTWFVDAKSTTGANAKDQFFASYLRFYF